MNKKMVEKTRTKLMNFVYDAFRMWESEFFQKMDNIKTRTVGMDQKHTGAEDFCDFLLMILTKKGGKCSK
jgi:hypothetical protein